MSDQMIWVHGNSGQLEVVHSNWGNVRTWGWGVELTCRVEASAHDEEPWLHFHIPLPSTTVEAVRTPPVLRKVILLIATDYNAPDPTGTYPPAGSNYGTRVKYVLDLGGAYVDEVDLWDGAALLYQWNELLVTQGLEFPEEKVLTLPPDAKVHWGLGVSVHFRFKNQMRLEKIEGTFQGGFGDGKPEKVVEGFQPEENPATRTQSKSAIVHSVGAQFVLPSP